jgi:hypothetical protein
MDLLRQLGETRARARAEAAGALTAAYDEIQRAYQAGDRVNIKQAAGLLGLTRQQIYTELDRRGVERARNT